MNIGTLPARTWEWLRVNDINTSDKMDAVVYDEDTVLDLKAGGGKAEPVYQDITPAPGKASGRRIRINVAAGADSTVIQFITSDPSGPASQYYLKNEYELSAGASLTLIQVQDLGSGFEFVNECGGKCEEGSSFHRIQIVLGGGETYLTEKCELDGSRSSYTCDLAYRLTGSHRLDVNYVADHNGTRTESNINVRGVMADESQKTFRGTIDFHRGCAGAKGAELEEVLILNDGIVNKTVPLILCDEEDVEGSHGATIGRLDENLMFYMKSRGLEEDEIYDMMSQARIESVVRLIDDEKARERVLEMLPGHE